MFAVYNYDAGRTVIRNLSRAAAESFCRMNDPLYLFLDIVAQE